MKQKIGRWQGASLLATTLLGTSVFILPQMTIDIAGEHALLAWFGLTLFILPVAVVFATLSSRFPHAAGPAHFVEQAFGSVAGRTLGLSFLLVVPIGAPAALIMTYQFVAEIFIIPPVMTMGVLLSFIGLLFLLNYRGIKVSATMQLLLTLAIAGILVVLLFVYTWSADGRFYQPAFSQSSSTLLSAAGLAFWSFLGIEAMSHLASDFKDPKRDLLPAIVIGTVLVGLVYLLCTYLLLAVPSTSELKIVGVFNSLVGYGGSIIIGWLGVAGGLATVNVYTASLTRLLCSFSQDRVLPRYFAKQNQFGVSVRSLVALLTVMSSVLLVAHGTSQDLEQLINLVNGVFVVIYFASMLAAIKLLKKRYYPLIGLSCLFCICMVIALGLSMLYAILLLSICAPFLLWQQHWRMQGLKESL